MPLRHSSMPAIVFDLDGTLVETAPDLHAVLAEVLGEEAVPAPSLAAIRHMVGDGARALLERALLAAGEPVRSERLERLFGRFLEVYTAEPCRFGHAYPGVEDTLARLAAAGHPLGVCTNKPQRPSELVLQALGLDRWLSAVVGGDALPVRKPDPAHLAAVLARLGAGHEGAVMVGDSRNDVTTARALGISCVLVSFGYTPVPARELGADAVIDRFADLPDALRGLTPPTASPSRPPA